MTKDQFLQHVRDERDNYSAWKRAADNMRSNAKIVEEHDPILATMARRLALAIEQYENRIGATLVDLSLDRLDQQEDEAEQMVADLFARVAGKGLSS